MTAQRMRSESGTRHPSWMLLGAMILIGFAAASVGCKDYSPTASAGDVKAVPASANVVHFKVEGLHCHGCAASARNAISKIEGVRRCNVSFDKGSAEVVMDVEEEDEIIARIVESVTELGFTVERSVLE